MNSEIIELLRQGNLAAVTALEGSDFDTNAAIVTANCRLGNTCKASELLVALTPADDSDKVKHFSLKFDILQTSGKHKEMTALYIQAREQLSSIESHIARCDLFLKLGEIEQMMSNDEMAFTSYSEALKEAKLADNDVRFFLALVGLHETLQNSANLVRREQVITLLDASSRKALVGEDPESAVKAAETLALLETTDDIEQLLSEKISEFESHGWLWPMASAVTALSRIQEYAGDTAGAIANSTRAVDLYRKMGAIPSMLSMQEQAASQLLNEGSVPAALAVLAEAEKSAESIGDLYSRYGILSRIAGYSLETGEYDRALDAMKGMVEIAAELNVKPTNFVPLLREAYRKAGDEMVKKHLGDINEEDFSGNVV